MMPSSWQYPLGTTVPNSVQSDNIYNKNVLASNEMYNSQCH